MMEMKKIIGNCKCGGACVALVLLNRPTPTPRATQASLQIVYLHIVVNLSKHYLQRRQYTLPLDHGLVSLAHQFSHVFPAILEGRGARGLSHLLQQFRLP